MKLLVASNLSGEQVQQFFIDFYQLDSAGMSAVIVTPERKKSIELGRGFSFCIIVSAVNESIANFLVEHTFSNQSMMAHWGWNNTFTVMEESEVMQMQFIERKWGQENGVRGKWGQAPFYDIIISCPDQ